MHHHHPADVLRRSEMIHVIKWKPYRMAVKEPRELTSGPSAIHGAFEVEDIVVLPIETAL